MAVLPPNFVISLKKVVADHNIRVLKIKEIVNNTHEGLNKVPCTVSRQTPVLASVTITLSKESNVRLKMRVD